jgi:hypothetical protein
MASPDTVPLDTRLYRTGLCLCPGEFRRDHGGEMAGDFACARREIAAQGSAALWTLRLQMAIDLARTIVVQWLRTGLPAIGCVALACSLLVTVSLASLVRRLSFRMPTDRVDAEGVTLVLLAAVVLMVVAATIVLNLWALRPRRPARR